MTEELSPGKTPFKVATIGHEGHGKTTLTAAIKHVMSMQSQANMRAYEHIDAPTDLIPDTITAAARFDCAILVVSAADGPLDQTRDHLQHAKQIGVPVNGVFLNFCDMVDDREMIELLEMEIRELLSYCGFSGDDTPIIEGSALQALATRSVNDPWADKVIELLATLDHFVAPGEVPAQEAPQATPMMRAAPMAQPAQASDSSVSPGAVPSFGERLRGLFGRKR